MILVVGSTGLVGREVCHILLQRGQPVRAMTRPTSNRDVVDDLRRRGAEIVAGDLKDRASLDAACRGASAVVSTASITLSRQEGDTIDAVDRDGQMSLVDAAKNAGVRKFVYVSFKHEGLPLSAPLADAKAAVESHLRESGIDFTILQPSFFMEVWLSAHLGFDAASGKARIYGSGQNPISWISLHDVAAFAADGVTNPAARNQIIQVGGPDALTPIQVVNIFEQATGRRFDVQFVPEDVLRAQGEAASNPLDRSFAAGMLSYAQGDPVDMSAVLRDFPVQLRSVREYAQNVR